MSRSSPIVSSHPHAGCVRPSSSLLTVTRSARLLPRNLMSVVSKRDAMLPPRGTYFRRFFGSLCVYFRFSVFPTFRETFGQLSSQKSCANANDSVILPDCQTVFLPKLFFSRPVITVNGS